MYSRRNVDKERQEGWIQKRKNKQTSNRIIYSSISRVSVCIYIYIYIYTNRDTRNRRVYNTVTGLFVLSFLNPSLLSLFVYISPWIHSDNLFIFLCLLCYLFVFLLLIYFCIPQVARAGTATQWMCLVSSTPPSSPTVHGKLPSTWGGSWHQHCFRALRPTLSGGWARPGSWHQCLAWFILKYSKHNAG